ncbi:MAG TPA: hypothetical protein VHZ97_01265 [Pseudonocardiaceae bacterium]|jgi:hypothetical protein|nr:hypothetical protein [Pseudonocardiaceae bacterium]
MRERLTSCPGQAHQRLRECMYRLLRLAEPATAPVVEPAPLPLIGGHGND